MNAFAFFNDTVVFSTKLRKGNDLPIEVSFESLFTPFGFLIPSSSCFGNIVDFLEGGETACPYQGILGALITPEGKVYEIGRTDDKFFPVRLLPGPGFRHGRADSYMLEVSVMTSLKLAKSPDDYVKELEEIVLMFRNTQLKFTVDEIVKMLHDRGINQSPKKEK